MLDALGSRACEHTVQDGSKHHHRRWSSGFRVQARLTEPRRSYLLCHICSRARVAMRLLRRSRRVATALTALLTLPGCYNEREELPLGATPISARPQYRFWWSLTEHCSGLTGEFASVRWYTVPNAAILTPDSSSPISGYWYPKSNSIVIAAASLDDGQLVRHEMLHALLQRIDHPRVPRWTPKSGH